MLGISKKKYKPTTYYALAFCTHVVAFCILLIGMFTSNWSTVTEEVGNSHTNVVYDRGLIVSCLPSKSCSGITDFSQLSDIAFADFVLGIVAVAFGFFIIQLFCIGFCVRSCREKNLAVPIAVLSIGEGALLMLILVLFEISITLDTLSGNIHRGSTFGFSRGLIVGAIVLYFIASFFIIGEYMRRRDGGSPVNKISKDPRDRARQGRNYKDRPRERERQPAGMGAAPFPPPYTRGYPVYNPETEEKNYSPANGMRPCKLPGCEMCSFVTGSPTFWGPAGVFNINERLTCHDSRVVYAIICVKDDKVFIGHSQRKLTDTFSEHLANIHAQKLDDPVANHFTRTGHSALDLRVSALARINCDSDTRARLEKALSYDMDRPHNSYYGINDDFEFL